MVLRIEGRLSCATFQFRHFRAVRSRRASACWSEPRTTVLPRTPSACERRHRGVRRKGVERQAMALWWMPTASLPSRIERSGAGSSAQSSRAEATCERGAERAWARVYMSMRLQSCTCPRALPPRPIPGRSQRPSERTQHLRESGVSRERVALARESGAASDA